MGYNDETLSRFRDRVRRERTERRGWTQGQLAERMTERGVPTGWHVIAKIEAGDRGVQIGEAAAIADVFGISVDQLCGRRARPVADRDFVLRRLHESLEDAQRSARVALRDIADRCGELAEVDHGGTFADVITRVQDACDQLADDAALLAQAGGAIAETRGNRAVWRAVRVKDNDQEGHDDA